MLQMDNQRQKNVRFLIFELGICIKSNVNSLDSTTRLTPEKMKINLRYVIGISLISALGGFLFGYDWVVIGGAKPFYERFFEISQLPGFQGLAMSSALIGCIGGGGNFWLDK